MMEASNDGSKNEFICGVVEGFYGRPWTAEQRRDLFKRMNKLGLSTYLYAPKDDLKHRAEWKQLYTLDEMDLLKDLINTAKTQNVAFVYALSPGVDIIYSREDDLKAIENKFEQVRSLGCNAFSLLFDDIEAVLHESDTAVFSSIVHAQVKIANEVFKYLGSPTFFFCPTEYCESRSNPSLKESAYLEVLGKSLLPEIHIFWTGPRIVSRYITVDHLQIVAKILNRKPLLWENLHANDYDPRRIFLGPYLGRSTKIKKEIAGILLNPNCRHEANFVPLCTVSEWLNSTEDIDEDDLIETEDDPLNSVYKSTRALKNAINKWLDHALFSTGNIQHSLNLMEVETFSSLVQKSLNNLVACRPLDSVDKMESSHPETNNLATGAQPVNSLCADYSEPMNLVVERSNCTNFTKENENDKSEVSTDVKFDDMSVEMVCSDVCMDEVSDPLEKNSCESVCLNFDHLATFVDIYFLPFEHGSKAIQILEEFSWLRENAFMAHNEPCSSSEDMPSTLWKEWKERSEYLLSMLHSITSLYQLLFELPNKNFVQELFQYVHEAQGVTSVLESLLLWMANGNLVKLQECDRFWHRKLDDGEPWIVSAGYILDMLRLLFITPAAADLLLLKSSIPLSLNCLSILPFKKEDKDLYKMHPSFQAVFSNSYDNQINDELNHYFDRYINTYFLCGQPATCFIALEHCSDKKQITSMICAVLNAKEFAGKIDVDDTACESWNLQRFSDIFYEKYPSQMDVRCDCSNRNALAVRRLICATAIALSMNGSSGFFTVLRAGEKEKIEFLIRLGLLAINEDINENFVLLGHQL